MQSQNMHTEEFKRYESWHMEYYIRRQSLSTVFICLCHRIRFSDVCGSWGKKKKNINLTHDQSLKPVAEIVLLIQFRVVLGINFTFTNPSYCCSLGLMGSLLYWD